MGPRHLALCILATASPLQAIEAQNSFIPLPAGQPLSIEIPAGRQSTSWVIDVPAGTRSMRIDLRASNPGQDLDLLLRKATPFDVRLDRLGRVDIGQMFDQSHFKSVSQGGEELLIVSDVNTIPLSAGRWYLGVVNFSSQTAAASLKVDLRTQASTEAIELVFDNAGTAQSPCDTSGWNSTESRTPVRGNSGTTLGQQRRLAAQEAARLLTQQLRPRVPVRIQMCWSDLGDASGNSFTLAQAGPRYLEVHDVGFGLHGPSLERPYTWYSAAAAAQQKGTTLCRFDGGLTCNDAFDVRATFNNKLDLPGGASFEYGFTGSEAGKSSFVSVAMHEILHGLGIFGLINLNAERGPIGSKLRLNDQLPLWDDAYGANVAAVANDGSSYREFLRISDEERAQALVSANLLRFSGRTAIGSGPDSILPPPNNFLRLHAPLTISAGSTYSHLASGGYGQQLMYPSIGGTGIRSLGLAEGMLQDLGWRVTAGTETPRSTAPSFQFYDPARNGHGIDFRQISPAVAGRESEYFMGFYTFDAAGSPEWYISVGPVIDGVFVPAANEFGDSLLRQTYLGPNNSVSSDSPDYSGAIRLDFNGARNHPACQDGHPGRRLDGPLAIMTARINGERIQWCMQPVVVPSRVQRDFSSIWYSLGDSGWGLALQSFDGATSTGATADGLFSILFYADATGKPRWAIGQVTDFLPGQPQPLRQVRGYCRTCPATDGIELSEPIGSMTLDLVRGGAAAQGNRISVDLTYPGSEGGRFQRSGVNLFANSDPTLGGN